ncbi:hypothetical protein PFISCL1PPCAC_21339, partial [Pristionchus fissidentatus]
SLRQLQQSKSCSSCDNSLKQVVSPSVTVSTPRFDTPTSEPNVACPPSDTVSNRCHSSDTIYSHSTTPALAYLQKRRSRRGEAACSSTASVQQLQHRQQRSQSASIVSRRSTGSRRRPPHQPILMDPTRDYSAEATKGAVVVYNVPFAVSSAQLLQFLARIGPVSDLHWPVFTRVTEEHYAVARYEDEESARRSAAILCGSLLEGAAVIVRRAKYWYTPNSLEKGKRRQEEEGEEVTVVDEDEVD